jgi:hypothetical protein
MISKSPLSSAAFVDVCGVVGGGGWNVVQAKEPECRCRDRNRNTVPFNTAKAFVDSIQ